MPDAWYAPRKPDEVIPYPWLHPSAVAYLEDLLAPEMRVLEHGAGGSTLWFAERVASVTTIEHNPAWATKIKAMAPRNVTMVLSSGIPDLEFVTAGGFDLFMIDGERETRGKCLAQVGQLVKPGGWVVLDNANRPEYAAEREGLRQHAVLKARFDNNIPRSQYFVTEFWKLSAAELLCE